MALKDESGEKVCTPTEIGGWYAAAVRVPRVIDDELRQIAVRACAS